MSKQEEHGNKGTILAFACKNSGKPQKTCYSVRTAYVPSTPEPGISWMEVQTVTITQTCSVNVKILWQCNIVYIIIIIHLQITAQKYNKI